MKRRKKRKINLPFIVTLLLLAAMPAIVIGTQKIQDIRNRAARDTSQLHFTTDFESDDVTESYSGVPYQQLVILDGERKDEATIMFGCDSNYCGDQCSEVTHDPPSGLTLSQDNIDNNSSSWMIWQEPQSQNGKQSFDVAISAFAPIESEGTEEYECVVETFTLNVNDEPADSNPICDLYFENENTQSVPQGRTSNFILHAVDYDDGLSQTKVTFTSPSGESEEISWAMDGETETIINKDSKPEFSYTFDEQGQYNIEAIVTDTAGNETTCSKITKVTEPKSAAPPQINIVIPGDNGSPEFQTDPYTDSNPGTNIDVGQSYTYTVEATDPEDDIMDYFIINQTGWLNFTVNESNAGNFRGTFSGTPTQPGSYTAVVSLNDGFHDHYSTQIWVINVNSSENDTPVVNVVLPQAGDSFGQNEEMRIEWEASDSNLIARFDIYLATDPSNQSTWIPIANNVGYNYDSYIWDTGSTAAGTYYIVVKATDNQNPAASGYGVSGAITITGGGKDGGGEVIPEPGEGEGEAGDGDQSDIPELYPQITNIKPPNKSKIEEVKPIISADLFASKDNTIAEGSVEVELDDQPITEESEIRGIGEADGSIVYTPEEPLTKSTHKVSVKFKDSSDQIAQKTWTFTIGEDGEEEEEDSDTISILGFDIPRRIALIIGVGLLLLLLALMIPWMFYAAWKRSRDEDEWDDGYVPPTDSGTTQPVTPVTPPSDSPYGAQPTSQADQTYALNTGIGSEPPAPEPATEPVPAPESAPPSDAPSEALGETVSQPSPKPGPKSPPTTSYDYDPSSAPPPAPVQSSTPEQSPAAAQPSTPVPPAYQKQENAQKPSESVEPAQPPGPASTPDTSPDNVPPQPKTQSKEAPPQKLEPEFSAPSSSSIPASQQPKQKPPPPQPPATPATTAPENKQPPVNLAQQAGPKSPQSQSTSTPPSPTVPKQAPPAPKQESQLPEVPSDEDVIKAFSAMSKNETAPDKPPKQEPSPKPSFSADDVPVNGRNTSTNNQQSTGDVKPTTVDVNTGRETKPPQNNQSPTPNTQAQKPNAQNPPSENLPPVGP